MADFLEFVCFTDRIEGFSPEIREKVLFGSVRAKTGDVAGIIGESILQGRGVGNGDTSSENR